MKMENGFGSSEKTKEQEKSEIYEQEKKDAIQSVFNLTKNFLEKTEDSKIPLDTLRVGASGLKNKIDELIKLLEQGREDINSRVSNEESIYSKEFQENKINDINNKVLEINEKIKNNKVDVVYINDIPYLIEGNDEERGDILKNLYYNIDQFEVVGNGEFLQFNNIVVGRPIDNLIDIKEFDTEYRKKIIPLDLPIRDLENTYNL